MTHLLEQWPQAVPFFEGLPQEEQEKIELCQIGPGELLIEKDSFAPPDLFFLVRGVCEHFRAFAESGDNDLTGIRLFAGQFIGVAEILSPQPMKRRNQVRAKTRVSALRIRGRDFLHWSQICLPVYNAILLYIIEQKHDDQRLYRECNVNNSLLAGARYISFLYSIYPLGDRPLHRPRPPLGGPHHPKAAGKGICGGLPPQDHRHRGAAPAASRIGGGADPLTGHPHYSRRQRGGKRQLSHSSPTGKAGAARGALFRIGQRGGS